jgi:uncharacterized Rmd1/YagE family protein
LPLLSGYSPNVNVRSSAAPVTSGESLNFLPHSLSDAIRLPFKDAKQAVSALSDAEEQGWEGDYFAQQRQPSPPNPDGYILSSPVTTHFDAFTSETEPEPDSAVESEASPLAITRPLPETDESDVPTYRPSNAKTRVASPEPPEQKVGEVVIFDYGVAVFLGFDERSERLILDDLFSVCRLLFFLC